MVSIVLSKWYTLQENVVIQIPFHCAGILKENVQVIMSSIIFPKLWYSIITISYVSNLEMGIVYYQWGNNPIYYSYFVFESLHMVQKLHQLFQNKMSSTSKVHHLVQNEIVATCINGSVALILHAILVRDFAQILSMFPQHNMSKQRIQNIGGSKQDEKEHLSF